MDKSTYEGRQDDIKNLELPEIESFANQYFERDYNVSFVTGQGELSSVCPKTGLPDFATLSIDYTPDKKCLELKSFKEYITAYRNVGIFHEFLANKILDDIVKAISPKYLDVSIKMNPRGNITTVVDVSYSK